MKELKLCKYCKTGFVKRSTGMYCSLACSRTARLPMTKPCKICKKEFTYYPSYEKDKRGYCCSKQCANIDKKSLVFEKSVRWKGEDAGYVSKHKWMVRMFGAPQECEHCGMTEIPKGKQRWFQWANISHEYKRERSDWKRLCVLCHRKFDSHLLARGEHQHSAKLNQFQVQRIRLMKEITPKLSYEKIGKIFGIAISTAQRICKRITWKHI